MLNNWEGIRAAFLGLCISYAKQFCRHYHYEPKLNGLGVEFKEQANAGFPYKVEGQHSTFGFQTADAAHAFKHHKSAADWANKFNFPNPSMDSSFAKMFNELMREAGGSTRSTPFPKRFTKDKYSTASWQFEDES